MQFNFVKRVSSTWMFIVRQAITVITKLANEDNDLPLSLGLSAARCAIHEMELTNWSVEEFDEYRTVLITNLLYYFNKWQWILKKKLNMVDLSETLILIKYWLHTCHYRQHPFQFSNFRSRYDFHYIIALRDLLRFSMITKMS